jgi:hypothetical protein
VARVTVDRWQGHLPAASTALSALLERAGRGGAQFTAPERALFAACEFWVAVQTRTLATHMSPLGADALRYLSIVYAAMGAPGMARLLIVAVGELCEAATPAERLQRLTALQERMAQTSEPVDRLIAGLAQGLGLSSAPGPGPVADSQHAVQSHPSRSWSRRGSSQAWWVLCP